MTPSVFRTENNRIRRFILTTAIFILYILFIHPAKVMAPARNADFGTKWFHIPTFIQMYGTWPRVPSISLPLLRVARILLGRTWGTTQSTATLSAPRLAGVPTVQRPSG